MATIIDDQPAGSASVWGTAAKWGAISGTIGFVLTIVFYNIGLMEVQPNGRFGAAATWLPFFIGIAIVFLGLKEYRDGLNGGRLSVGTALKWGLGYGLVAGIIGAITSAIFFGIIAPDLMEDMRAMQMAQLEEQGMSDAEVERAMEFGSMFMGPAAIAIFGLIGTLFFAFVQSLVVGLILRRE